MHREKYTMGFTNIIIELVFNKNYTTYKENKTKSIFQGKGILIPKV